LTARAAADAPATDGARAPAGKNGAPAAPAEEGGLMQGINEVLFGSTGSRGGKRDGVVQSVAKSTARQMARELVRGVLGSLLGSRRR
ncbi:helicase HerA-like domain-containing protein, partial [Bordetella pertussis]